MHIANTNEVGPGDVDWSEPEICYKLVKQYNGYLISCTITNQDHPNWCTFYTPLQRVVPKRGKLFVFDSQNHAEMFWRQSCSPTFEEIWLAHGERLQLITNILPFFQVEEKAAAFWYIFGNNNRALAELCSQMAIYPAPVGTMLSDSVTLIKRVV